MIAVNEGPVSDQFKASVHSKNSCRTCENERICKYAEEYTKYENELRSFTNPDVANVEISCKYFKGTMHTKRPETPIRGVDEVVENKRSFTPTRPK